MPFCDWSHTPLSNALIDTLRDVKWNEGMFGPQYNDSARAMMSELKKFADDQNGTLVTTGTSTAYEVASNQDVSLAADVPDGFTMLVTLHAAPGAAATVELDGQPAKPILIASATALPAGSAAVADILGLIYVDADNAFYVTSHNRRMATDVEARAGLVENRTVNPKQLQLADFPAGTRMMFQQTAAPTGWTKDVSAGVHDRALRFTTGTAGAGGSQVFSSCFSASRIPTGTNALTAITAAQMAPHYHDLLAALDVGGAAAAPTAANFVAAASTHGGLGSYATVGVVTGPTVGRSSVEGAGSGHGHTWTGNAMNFEAAYLDVIIATRNA